MIVDDLLRTTGDRIYVAGDFTGRMPFTHVAAYEARLVVTSAMFRARRSARYDLTELDRAVMHASNRGWTELVGDPRRRLVGATIVSTTVHAYPTFAEGPSRAADDVLRSRYFNPRLTRFTAKLLGVLRRLDAPRGS